MSDTKRTTRPPDRPAKAPEVEVELPPRRAPKGTVAAVMECLGLLSHEEAAELLNAIREMREEDREAGAE